MTCLEKLKQMHPEMDDNEINAILEDQCPDEYGILGTPEFCDPYVACEKCWNRQIPTEDLTGLQETLEMVQTCAIKDSGERQQFSTGAVRDIQKGKGRCDLLPLDVVAECCRGDLNDDVSGQIFDLLDRFTMTGDISNLYEVLSKRVPFEAYSTMFLEVSKHFEEGAEKYGENNWQKGLPVNCYINSAVRHYLKYMREDKDEPHDRAFCWNIMCAIWTCKHKPELNCYPITAEEK